MTQHERAKSYFALSAEAQEFWKWTDDATGVLWANGSLVASREELVSILRHLQATGLPPFGAIVLLAAGCRGEQITIQWLETSEDDQRNKRVPCIIESGGKVVRQRQRVLRFGTPESISGAATRLRQLPSDLKELLAEAAGLPELADLLLSDLKRPLLSEGIITLLATGQFTGRELNYPERNAMYSRVLEDLALLSRSFDKLPPELLRLRLSVAIAGQGKNVNSSPPGSIPSQRKTERHPQVREIRQFSLPLHRTWQQVSACDWGFCAASLAVEKADSQLVVVRSNWEGVAQIARWQMADPKTRVIVVPVGDERVLVHQPSRPMLSNQFLPQLEGVFAKRLVVGCGGWLPTGTLQLVWNGGYVWFLARRPAEAVVTWRCGGDAGYFILDTHPPRPPSKGETHPQPSKQVVYETNYYPERLQLNGHDTDGFCWAQSAELELQQIGKQPAELVPMVTMGHSVGLAAGTQLLIFDSLALSATYNFEQIINRLFVGKSGRKTGIVICLERGVKLHWHGSDEVQAVDDQAVNPVAGFTTDGRLVVVGDHHGRVYDLDRHGVTAVKSFEWLGPAPVAVMATGLSAEFATLSTDGPVRIWAVG